MEMETGLILEGHACNITRKGQGNPVEPHS